MKPWIVITCLSLIGCTTVAQQPQPTITTYGHFKLDGQELIWQHVIDTTLRPEDVRTFYNHLSRMSDITLEDNTLLASFDMLTFDGNRYGGIAFGHWALVSSTPLLSGRLKIDLKNDRYRITVYDLRFIDYPEDKSCAPRYQSASHALLMREARSIKPTAAVPDVLGVYDRFFQEYFPVHASAREDDF
ncbi:hypothetical protein [Parachryseolinea silvisoli]|jgi:hypothetical protein|uniref:hypothetical protein n=1 Tax=Parachryseolinea silvisoli TaxID=2873601 RepID=UPI002265A8E0|nr:hypothetical protein [Parachryseolinea silvisoli]MCD9016729.1 hypothetical protein [Parachryseolinea silvisoli]